MARKIGRVEHNFKTSVWDITFFEGFTTLDWMQIRSYQRVWATAKDFSYTSICPARPWQPGKSWLPQGNS
jgi:hypothetical protein